MEPGAAINKASVDYTSPALCTTVTPLPPTGDAAYRQHTGGGPSHDIGHMHKKLVKIALVVPEIFSRTDGHRDKHTHHNSSQPLTRAK